MLTHKHAFISVAVGAVGWWATGSPLTTLPLTGAAALLAGTLPDVDHIADYLYFNQTGEHRLILPLHGYEYAILGGGAALLSGNPVAIVATLSYLIHLLADQMENRTHKLGYSLLFRARHRFRIEAISTMPEAAIRGREADLELLRNLRNRNPFRQ